VPIVRNDSLPRLTVLVAAHRASPETPTPDSRSSSQQGR